MFRIQTERFGDVAVVHCEGRIVQDAAALRLRDAVRQQRNSRAILVDLSDVESLEGGGLGMLLSLQKWTYDRGISFRVFDPSPRVQRSLERFRNSVAVEIAGIMEVVALLNQYSGELNPQPSQFHALARSQAA